MPNQSDTNSPLKNKITEDMRTSMKSGNKKRLGAIKLILSAILDKEVETRKVLTDEIIFEILKKLSKKNKDSLAHYEAANRTDLIEQEVYELSVFKEYMPEDMPQEQIQKMIEEIITEKSIQKISQIGEIISELKKRSNNRADIAFASKFIKNKFS